MDRYRICLYRAQGCWFARAADLPGCIARGRSQVEAIEHARALIRAYLWMAQALAEEPAELVLEIRA
jgi:predicted RNase H-like HicB family nuclease